MTNEQPQTPEELKRITYSADIESAIKRNAASFELLIWVLWQSEHNPDQGKRSIYAKYYPELLKAFESAHGVINCLYDDSDNELAAVLTSKGEIDCGFGDRVQMDSLAIKFISDCSKIEYEVRRLLEGTKDFYIYLERLYELITYLLGVLGDNPTSNERNSETNYLNTIDFLNRELTDVKDSCMRSAQRHAQMEYLKGILVGTLAISVVASMMAFVLYLLKNPIITLASVFWSLISGGVGAMISVMTRMSKKGYKIDQEAGPEQIRNQGIFRPIIGSIMGVIVTALMLSNLLPITIPENASTKLYFFIVIAFISGFSERWAPNILEVVSSRIMESAGKDSEKKPTSKEKE